MKVLLLAPVLGIVLLAGVSRGQDCNNSDTYGTAIHWVRTAAEAQKLARAEDKLIFVVHLSGNFTRDAFT
jgi:hypothetical protein